MSDRERLCGGGFTSKHISYGSTEPAIVVIDENASPDLSQSHCKETAASGKHLSFHDVSYEVSTGCFGKGRKVILDSVSGLLPTGLNAIMGPTGSGKTSLLDILAGRKGKSGVSGHVLVNGERQPKNFKCASGYVVQDDVVMGTLSVRENLHFSAALRLPSYMTFKQRKERVERVIEELGLERCASTKVGTEFLRGVSGGERKRTNIGMELIIKPQILFLDEPTTGLDANTAVSVLKLLKRLSVNGERIIVVTIHQPRYSIFKLFDTLTLLSLGEIAYHGPARQALEYFDVLGFPCEEHENPADFFLDVITYCEAHSEEDVFTEEDSLEEAAKPAVDLRVSYQDSNQYRAVQKSLTPILDGVIKHNAQVRAKQSSASYATNVFWQLLILTTRSVVNLSRNPMTSFIQLISTTILALVVGLIYFQLNNKTFNPETIIQDRTGALFFIVLNQMFSTLSAIELFIKERAIFIHENSSGFYRVSVYFLSKVFADLIPMRLIPLTVFSVIAYFMVGFQIDVEKFFIFFLTLALLAFSAASLAFAISSRVAVVGVANLLISMMYVLSMLFGGFLVALDTLPVWIRWLKYLSITRYATEALSINEIAGECFCPDYINTTTFCDVDCVNGTRSLSLRGFETSTSWLWYDQVGLAGLSLVFLTITYLNLRTVKKRK